MPTMHRSSRRPPWRARSCGSGRAHSDRTGPASTLHARTNLAVVAADRHRISPLGSRLHRTFGGRSPAGLHPGPAGPTQPHGLFMENHGCTYDPRPTTQPNTIVVSDRRNMRFEFFHYDPDTPDTFDWYKTVDMSPSLGPGTLPCNMRMTHGSKFNPSKEGRSVVPDLAGPVAVLDNQHRVLSVVNVSVLLAAEQHKHPHDALFLANGDIVVGTWAPGRISYWKRLPNDDDA